jgi:hypothetical protein
VPESKQIQLSASSRGIVDHFFCFTCDEYVWDCDHLIDDRLSGTSFPAREGSRLRSFAYGGQTRVLEIEFRVTASFTHGEIQSPPPPQVIQYDAVPRYVFTKLISLGTAVSSFQFPVGERFQGRGETEVFGDGISQNLVQLCA